MPVPQNSNSNSTMHVCPHKRQAGRKICLNVHPPPLFPPLSLPGVELCGEFKIDADSLGTKWEAFCMNNTNKMEATQIKNPDEQAIAMFSNYIRAKGKVVQKKGGRKSFLNNGSVMELNPASPQVPTKIKRERDAPVVSPALMSSKAQKLNGVTLTSRINQYENRLQAGKLMLTFNGDKVKRAMPAIKDEARLPGVKKESSRNRGVHVSKVVGFANKNYKFMYATLEDRASQLETSCLNLTSQIVSEYKLDEPSPISLPSQEPVVLCGKICCDAQHGKLNPTAVLLEGTMALSAGRSVKQYLRFQRIDRA